jgi:hypothetical protein
VPSRGELADLLAAHEAADAEEADHLVRMRA